MIESRLNLVVALPAEARPLTQQLGLQRLQTHQALPVYAGNSIALILSGHGMAAAAEGTRQLHRLNPDRRAGWLNIGIAGHADLPLGTAFIASKVIAPTPEKSWPLRHPDGLNWVTGEVRTVTHPDTDYSKPGVYDMEAAGFVSAALEFADPDRIQVLKIVSDNRANPTRNINAKMVSDLLRQRSDLICNLVHRMINDYV